MLKLPTSIYRRIFRLGAKFRNPSLLPLYRELRESELWSREHLEAQQAERLAALLQFAHTHSPYYRKVLAEVGWQPRDLVSWDAFRRIPVIDKANLISNRDAIHSRYDFGKTFLCETSGTSGEILTFRRDERWDSFNRAAMMRGYAWHDVRPWDFNLYFWGYNIDKRRVWRIRLLDALANRHRIFRYSDEALNAFEQRIDQATYIEGYSSMIYEFARRMDGRGIDPSRLKLIKGTSEKIFPHYSKMTEEVFGRPIVSEYGAAESGLIAFECPAGSMHVTMEGVYLETDDDGSVIVTNLLSRSFPIIRYRLGDRIRRAPDAFRCGCGRDHPVIEEVTGRIGHAIVGRTDEFPSLTLYYVFKTLFFDFDIELNYQGRQLRPGELEIAIQEVPDDGVREKLSEVCGRYFGDELDITFAFGADIRSDDGKLRDFVSTL